MDDKQKPEKPVKPAVMVRFQGIRNCTWQTKVNDYGLTEVVNSDGDLIASVMPIPGDTPDKKFHRIHAEIIAASAHILMSGFDTRGTHDEDKSVHREISRLVERIDRILNEPHD